MGTLLEDQGAMSVGRAKVKERNMENEEEPKVLHPQDSYYESLKQLCELDKEKKKKG
jgi:hypothetical protein